MATVADGRPSSFNEDRLLDEYKKLISIRDHTVPSKPPSSEVESVNRSASIANTRVSALRLTTASRPSAGASNEVAKAAPVAARPSLYSSSLPVSKPTSNSFHSKSPHVQKLPASNAGPSGIDPIFLTKSTILVKAELQQKRQRLEKALEEQVHKSQRQKARDQDVISDFDVTLVLKKAQELVKPTKLQDSDRTIGVASSNDSFDENTFYSSQMDESTTTEDVDEANKWRPRRICRFFLRGEDCHYGDSCTFSHDPALKQKIEADGSQVNDLKRINADEQAISHQDVYPNKRTQKNDSQIKPNAKEMPRDAPIPLSQGERDMQERIARLEAELISAKAAKDALPNTVPRQQANDTYNSQEESIYSPPGADEFGRDAGLREHTQRQPATVPPRRNSPIRPLPVRDYDRRNGDPPSPLHSNVRVVTNHIRSPAAPQPSRVSPLAVARVPQVSQIQHEYGEISQLSRASDAETLSAGQSPNIANQPRSSRKRRRGRNSGDQTRNVMPRTDPESPFIRVKEEPTSPPLFNIANPGGRQLPPRQETTRQLLADTSVPQYRDEEPAIYQSRAILRPSYGHLKDDIGPQTPVVRRVVSRNGQQYLATEESDLRRVVTAPRQVRAPMSPAPYPVQYSAPQQRATRAVSQVYISPTSQGPPHYYRDSVPQPSTYAPHERSPSPKAGQIPQSAFAPRTIAMAPPPRRIVVDQWGNRFVEAPVPVERHASMAPVIRGSEPDSRYEQVFPRSASVLRQPQVLRVEDDGQYVRRAPSPAPNGVFEEYPDSRPLPRYEEVPAQDARIIRMPSIRPAERRYDEGPNTDERIVRMQSVRPVESQFEAPREQTHRVQSVRPEQPRIIHLGDRRDPGRHTSRQLSVVPDDGGFRQVKYATEERPRYQYAPQLQSRGYVEEIQDDGGYYEAPNSGGRRMMQRM